MRAADRVPLPWLLVGIHATRFDIGSRDLAADESLGLNAAWYPDIVTTLTELPPRRTHLQLASRRPEPGTARSSS